MFASFIKISSLRFIIFVWSLDNDVLVGFSRLDPVCKVIRRGNAALFYFQAAKSQIKK